MKHIFNKIGKKFSLRYFAKYLACMYTRQSNPKYHLGILLLILVSLGFNWGNSVKAQTTSFEGVIQYEVRVRSKQQVRFPQLFAQNITLYIKENRILCQYENSGIDSLRLSNLLIHGDSNAIYRFLPELKMVQRKKLNEPHPTEQVFPPEHYHPLERKERIAGMMCDLYTADLTMPMGGGKAKVTLYCSDELVFPVKGDLIEQSTIMILGYGLKGIPLKKIVKFEELGTEIHMTAVKIEPKILEDKLFELPQRVRIVPFDRSSTY